MAYGRGESGHFILKKKLQFLLNFSFPRKVQRTYILPTPFGFAFAGLALVLLLMAIGYANNLIYLYAFAVISVALSSMYVTNKNIDRLQIKGSKIEFAFANEDNRLIVKVENLFLQPSYEISFSSGGESKAQGQVNGYQTLDVQIPWCPASRGPTQTPLIKIESRFPFGLLRSWKTSSQSHLILVYPERRGVSDFPSSASGEEQGALGLFRDHRAYQSTDSPRRVDWRATAKFQTLLVKNFEGFEKGSLAFTWDQTAAIEGFEDKISQLSLWVSKAHDLSIPYSLHIGEFTSDLSSGTLHFKKCMEHLSLLKKEDIS